MEKIYTLKSAFSFLACLLAFTLTTTHLQAQCPTVTVTAADSLLCGGGSTILTVTAPLDSGSISTPVVNNNGQDGNMFDITANRTITIRYFEGNIANTPNATTTYYVYYKVGTFVGSETNAAAWTLIAGPITFNPNAPNTFTRIPAAINVTIPAGQTYGFYLTNTSAASNNNRYHSGTATGAVLSTNADLTIYEGNGGAYPFSASFFNARPWEGTVIYSVEPTYLWSTGATTQSISVAPSATTDYSAEVTYSLLASCTSSDTQNVAISLIPPVDLGTDITQCGGTVTLNAGTAGSYAWNTGASSQTITVDTTGTYYVDVTDTLGCLSTDTIDITVNPQPYVYFNSTFTMCQSDPCLTLIPQVFGVTGPYTSQWFPSAGLSSDTAALPCAAPPSTTTYSLMVQDIATGCSSVLDSLASVLITVDQLPSASFTHFETALTVSFANTSANATSYLWDFGNGQTSTLPNPTHTYATDGIYTVTLIASNNCGDDTTTVTIDLNSVATADPSLIGQVQIYPNPNTGTFKVALKGWTQDNGTLQVHTLLGERIYARDLNILNQDQVLDLELPALSKGIYLLQISAGEHKSVNKLIIR